MIRPIFNTLSFFKVRISNYIDNWIVDEMYRDGILPIFQNPIDNSLEPVSETRDEIDYSRIHHNNLSMRLNIENRQSS